MKTLNSKVKMGLIYLTPIIASLLFGFLCALTLLIAPLEVYPVTPFQEGIGSFGNALYFVILVAVGATVIYILLKRRNKKIITFITGFALTAATLMLSIIYLTAIFSTLNIPYADTLSLIPSILITALTVFIIFRTPSKISSLAILLLGGALGTFLGSTIPTLSAILILGFLAVYDTFAVYRGPVGKIARSGLENLRGLSYSFKDIQMGLGDLTFYSMLSGHMLLNFGYTAFIASTIGILCGCALSFKMLEKKGMFPGLPFPILFGLAAGLLTTLVF
jgi:presenilin-like A22 family membrane protease